MSRAELKSVIEYVLNKATDEEVGIIISAIKKRSDKGPSMARMSRKVASGIQDQLSMPVANIRNMVMDMAIKMIKQSAPDIPDDHLKILLKEWFPESMGKSPPKKILPPDVLFTMIKHFVKYSTGTMQPGEEMQLKKSMPNWYEEYWEAFPDELRESINLLLKDKIDMETFWSRVKSFLDGLT